MHTSAHVPTRAASRMLFSIGVSPMPPRFTGSRASLPQAARRALALRQRARLGADDPVEGRRDVILSCGRAASMVRDGGMQ